MGRVDLLLIIAASILIGCLKVSEAGYEEVIHVGGKVMCQDCTQGWNEWVNGDRPIPGAKVSVTCMDGRSRVMYYGSDDCDETGEFNLIINSYVNGEKLDVKGCSVRLVWSPDQTCDVLTNFAGGQTGVKLKRPSSVYRDLIKYTVGPFYFTSPMCEEPDTEDITNEENNY